MDKKEIIRRLKRMSERAVYIPGKPPFIMSLDDGVAADEAAVLLEEQETEDTGKCRVFQCKKCGFGIDDIFVNDEEKYQIVPRYCPNCGRSVKWDG
jgi:predicted RNA-binding Zn-ribbon protein involved in translation (DUF1610 family)